MQAGETFSKALNRLGFFTLVYPEYPSRIRGGDNNIQVVFSSQPALSPSKEIDILLAFGQKNFKAHQKELKKNGLQFEGSVLGLDKIAQELGNPLVMNTAGLGFLWAILGLDLEVLRNQVTEDFSDEKIRELNLKAVEKGFEKGLGRKQLKLTEDSSRKIVNLSGNEALTQGILAGKCGFAAIYPMTPINEILRLLANSKIELFRPEDEIAGINAAIGAAFAGRRAIVATSGGGFSLMVEALGMAGMAEIPVVIIVGQRTGPSTGIATFSSQADLNFVIHAGQGEFPKIVLAPGDLREAYWLGAEAFNLAEVYQVPVILLIDKYLAESRFSTIEVKTKVGIKRGKLAKELKNYRRYEFTDDGISPRAFPGQTTFLTNSYEHDEFGFSSDEVENRERMMEKRAKKVQGLKEGFEVYGKDGGRGTLVGWGSTKEIILDVLKDFPEFNFVHFWRLWPFPREVKNILGRAREVIVIEGNFSGQLADLIEKETGLKTKRILKDNGRPFFREEMKERISSLK